MRSFAYLASIPKKYFFASRDLKLLYYERVIRDLVNKLAFFFFPIYLFQLGTNLLPSSLALTQWQAGLLTLAGYFILSKLLVVMLVIPIGKLTSKIGYQRALAYSYIFRLISFLGLFLSVSFPAAVFISIATEAIQVAFYWPSYHTLLANNSLKKNLGSNLGGLQVLLLLIGAVTPAISGILNTQLGFQFVFFLGILGAMASFCLILLISDSCDLDTVSFSELKEWLGEKRYERLTTAIAGRYVYDVVLFIWPFYLFTLFGSVERVGILATLSLFLALIVSIISTFKLDSLKSRTPYKISGVTIALTWFLRTQLFSVWGVALADALDRVSSNYHWLFFDTIWYKRGKGSQAHSFFVYHELLQNLAVCIIWMVILAVLLISGNWKILFILSGLGVLATLMLKEKGSDKN